MQKLLFTTIATVLVTILIWQRAKCPITNDDKDTLEKYVFKGNPCPSDPLVQHYLRKYHLHQPPIYKHYSFVKSAEERKVIGNNILDAFIKAGIQGKTEGFYIECGAADGEWLSNTLGLEISLRWTGVLLEGSPSIFKELEGRHRKAWIANICLTGKYPEQIEFLKSKDQSGWKYGIGKVKWGDKYEEPKFDGKMTYSEQTGINKEDYYSEGLVNCFPLESILESLNINSVDFLSLDIEGHEYKVLEHFPFEKIRIKVIFVESVLIPEGKLALRILLERNGYVVHSETNQDYLFVKTNL